MHWADDLAVCSGAKAMNEFVELCAATNFSFLRGASHPSDMVIQAQEIGLKGIAIADRNTLAGVVRGWAASRKAAKAFPYRVGTRLVFRDGTPDIFAWPRDRTAFGRLTRLLTSGNRRTIKGACHLDLADLLEAGRDIVFGVMPGERLDARLEQTLGALRDAFPGQARLMARMTYDADDHRRLSRLKRLASRHGTPLTATNDALYHHPDRRRLQDVLTCIREHVTLAEAGRRLEANAERHLKPPVEMARLFRHAPEAIRESLAVWEELQFSLDDLKYQYPDEALNGARNATEALEKLVNEGARWRYPQGVPDKVRKTLAHELGLIARWKYEHYFLTVHHIVDHARKELKILCQGRGSAANSAVCFCLGITEIDPADHDLLFERFLSENRNEPPDIDVDFEHERREEVMQHIYEKYGRERAGIAATVITYRSRSAIREVGKAFGLSDDVIGALSGMIWGWSNGGITRENAEKAGLDIASTTTRQVIELTTELMGFPRHLSQHVGGYVISRNRLDESVPILNAAMPDRTFIEWDKDDLDEVNMVKVDVLALGMLTCIRKGFDFLRHGYGIDESLASVLATEGRDPAVYDMLCKADSLGVFQVESRAQMTMLPRLRPREFYDLVIEVAIVRPGPIQGDMVHPYLRRKDGKEKPDYPKRKGQKEDQPSELEAVLERTMGVPLFQEQAMKIAIVAAGFTPAESDGLRRAMATFRHSGTIGNFKEKFISGMVARGYERDFAERCFRQIEGFGEYGFPESHAFSFALLVYVSAWMKCHYPDVFCAALLNSQPMGFYAPAQIVRDAREHGVEVRAVDVNFSDWDNTLEKEDEPQAFRARMQQRHHDMADAIHATHAVRLGLRQVKGLSEKGEGAIIMAKRGRGYDSVRDLWLRTGLPRAKIERLADADAFRSLGLDRRAALWAAQALEGSGSERLPLFDADGLADIRREPDVDLPPMPPGEHVVNDYRFLSLSLKAHPVSFLRARLDGTTPVIRNEQLAAMKTGRFVTVSGLVLVRQRPGSASGVIFMTIEDETGVANIIVWPKVFERLRPVVLGSRFITVAGRMQNESGVIHVVANRLEDRTEWLAGLSFDGRELESLARADEVRHPQPDSPELVATFLARRRKARAEAYAAVAVDAAASTHAVMPKGRNFQ